MACYQKLKTSSTHGALMNHTSAESSMMLNEVDGEPSQPTVAQRAITFIKKSVSSVVIVSYLSLTVGQSYAMDGKVAPFDGHEGIELKSSHSTPKKFSKHTVVPIELDSPTSVTGLLDQQCLDSVEKGLGVKSHNKSGNLLTEVVVDHLPGQNTLLKQEEKADDDRLAQALFGERKNKIHPELIDIEAGLTTSLKANEDEKDDDNESVHSEEESPEEKAKRDAILDQFDSTVKHITREEMTKADWTILIAPLLLTAVVGFGYKFDLRGELYGETRLQVGTTVSTYALTEPGYRYVYMDIESSNTIDTLIEVLTYNNYVFLAPYLIARFSELTQYLYDAAYCPYQKTKINPVIKSMTVLATFIAALSIGGTVASQFYSANIGFDDEFELDAQEITPYLWVLYTADAFLRYSQFKDRILQYFYVTKMDDLEASNARKSLIQKLRYSKAVVASMSDEELLKLDIKKVPAGAIDNERRMHGLDAFQNLIDIGKDKTKRRYSIKTTKQNHELSQKFSMFDFFAQNIYLGVGGVIASVGAYLTYNGAKDNFDNAMQMKFPNHFGLPDFTEMGTKAFQELCLIMYKIWEIDTQNIVVYDGNGTDWCTQCRQSTKYSNGNIIDGGDFIFTDCPGVGFSSAAWSVPGDWDYTEEKCDVWYNLFDHYLPSLAGVTTDDYYAPAEIDPLTLSMAQVGTSISGAAIVASVSGAYAALAVKDAVTRVNDSFSNEPQEILPGKRNKWVNAGVLSLSGIQSMIRAIPCGVAGWYYLQSRVDDHAFLGSLVGFATVSSALNYFCDFDTTYSAFPGKIRKAKSYLKKNVLPLLSINDIDYRDSHVICDDHLDQMNQIIHMFENAPADMVKNINQALYTSRMSLVYPGAAYCNR